MGLFDFFKKDKSDVDKYYEERSMKNDTVPQNTATYQNNDAENNFSYNSGFEVTVQDVFMITGRGVVVTGKISAGSVCVGETVTLVKQNGLKRNVTVTGLEKFRKMLNTANAGENVGILLSGVGRGEIDPGDMLIK